MLHQWLLHHLKLNKLIQLIFFKYLFKNIKYTLENLFALVFG